MKVESRGQQVPKRSLPLPTKAGPQPLGVIDSLGTAQLGSVVADLGLGFGEALAHNPTTAAMGVAMSGLHLARGVATWASAQKESGAAKNARLGSAAGEVILAGGHLAGAVGGAWGLPILLVGTAVAYETDRRYRDLVELGPKGKASSPGPMGFGQKANNLADASLGLVQLSVGAPGAVGALSGASHLAQAAYSYSPMGGKNFNRGFGHALIAIGQISGALGTGAWWLAPVLGGMLTTNLEDHRSRSWL